MNIFEIDPLQDVRWTAFTCARSDASVFHRVEWLGALKTCYGYDPIALTTAPPGVPLKNALVFCKVRSAFTGHRLVSLPFSDSCEPLVDEQAEIDLFLAYLAEKVDQDGLKYFEFRPTIHSPTANKSLAISHAYYLHLLDIRQSEESLFKSFHKSSVQRRIIRAERAPLRYEAGSNEVLLKHFYKLLIMTRRRHNVPPQPMKWFRTLLAHMGQDATIHVALKDDIAVASILTISDKRTLVYKYGCSDSRYSNLGGFSMLLWKAITDAKARNFKTLDLGRSDLDNPGLVTYKEHWGAQRSLVNYWRYPARAAGSRPEAAVKYIRQLISVAPDTSLVMLGNILYRHIG